MSNPDPHKQGSPLWRVFWLYGVAASSLLWALLLWMLVRPAQAGVIVALLGLLLAYTAWIVIAVWRAAPRAADPRYGLLARALTVTWAINTVLLVFFLGLQRLA